MSHLKAYHRPQTLLEALQLLNRPNALPLAGGTWLNANMPAEVEEVVDLQALNLTQIQSTDHTLTLGAMVKLQEIVTYTASAAEGTVFSLLHQTTLLEGANTMRHVATIGGVISSGDSESELLAAMLVCSAQVTLQNLSGTQTIPLSDLLSNRVTALKGSLIISATLHLNGQAAHDRVARTPKDKPIVAAIARYDGTDSWLALCGVASTPILMTPNQLDNLTPPDDFRGSTEYRLAMARLLVGRVQQLASKSSS